jgi:hypothetical protein
MGRSVYVSTDAVRTVYTHMEIEDQWEWEDLLEDLRAVVQHHYPSFDREDSWMDREGHIVLVNGHARVVVGEYCGCVSISLVPLEHEHIASNMYLLSQAWCERVAKNWYDKVSDMFKVVLAPVTTMSNGVTVYEVEEQE